MIPIWLKAIALGLAAYEGTVQLQEIDERYSYWRQARAYCDSVGKPLLRIGIKRGLFEPPNGDVTLDIDPIILSVPGGVKGDERDMPFTDRQFGICFNEHTMEHLHYPEDVQAAVNECCRVADYAIFLCPSPYSIIGLLHPDHNLRIWFKKENRIVVQQLKTPRKDPDTFGQVIVSPWGNPPEVII